MNIIKVAEVNISNAIKDQSDSAATEKSLQKQWTRKLSEAQKKLAQGEGAFPCFDPTADFIQTCSIYHLESGLPNLWHSAAASYTLAMAPGESFTCVVKCPCNCNVAWSYHVNWSCRILSGEAPAPLTPEELDDLDPKELEYRCISQLLDLACKHTLLQVANPKRPIMVQVHDGRKHGLLESSAVSLSHAEQQLVCLWQDIPSLHFAEFRRNFSLVLQRLASVGHDNHTAGRSMVAHSERLTARSLQVGLRLHLPPGYNPYVAMTSQGDDAGRGARAHVTGPERHRGVEAQGR